MNIESCYNHKHLSHGCLTLFLTSVIIPLLTRYSDICYNAGVKNQNINRIVVKTMRQRIVNFNRQCKIDSLLFQLVTILIFGNESVQDW